MKKNKTREAFTNVKKDVDDLRERIAVLETQSKKSRTEVRGSVRTEPNFEEKALQQIRKAKPEIIKQKILQLIEGDMGTTNIERIIVREKKLCGKTQFYHYLKLIRTELRTEVRTEPKIKIL